MASGSVRYPVPEGERWTDEALARLVGKAVIVNGEPGGTVTSARIGSDGWIELDMEFTGQDWDIRLESWYCDGWAACLPSISNLMALAIPASREA